MSFDFFEQPDHQHENNNDLFDIMKKMEDDDNFNVDFDHFDDPAPDPQHDHSADSDFFRQKSEKKESQRMQSAKSRQPSNEFQFENSRNISEISIIEHASGHSFRYEAPPINTPPQQPNQRYLNLQRLLNKAKTNSLDNFYKTLDQQNTYKNEEKFRNKEEFKQYRNQLKAFKKTLEEDFQAKNGNYRFNQNHYPPPPKPKDQQIPQKDNYNFKKKTSARPEINNFFQSNHDPEGEDFFNINKVVSKPKTPPPSNPNPKGINFLPTNDFQDDDLGDDYELKPEDINREIQKYEQREYEKQAMNFFTDDSRKQRQQRPAKKLDIINEERPNLFEISGEEQKMSELVKNYNQLKSNFNSLMNNLKENNTDQEKIISQLKRLKNDYEENKQSRLRLQEQSQKEKQQAREQLKQEKAKKINEFKEEIHKIKDNSDKEVLILKLNEKVESLEEVLRTAIQELNKEKDPKIIPKIINYYQEPQQQPLSSRSNSRRSNRLDFAEETMQEPPLQEKMSEDFLIPVRNAIRELRDERREEAGEFTEEFSSPLQLDLTVQDYPLNLSRGRSMQLQQPFIPAEGSKQYQPTPLDSNNKFLRRCLTQKSSILFESFEFYVTGKFTVTGNDRFPVTCEIRVANKCAISLYDVFVIVYGPQAQEIELEMRPAKIMHDQFKHSTSFLFEVDLGRSCLENGYFSIQISYKSEPKAKKKVNFKATLPFAHLIKPEFIYEEQFVNAWNHMENQYFVRPKLLDFKNIRSHEDLKLILPFTEVNEADPNCFSYGIMFTFPKLPTLFMLKVTCYVSGKASLHLKSSQGHAADRRLREQTLDILSFLIFG